MQITGLLQERESGWGVGVARKEMANQGSLKVPPVSPSASRMSLLPVKQIGGSCAPWL